MIRSCFLFAILFAPFIVIAQNNSDGTTMFIDPCLDSKGNAYMDRKAGAFLAKIDAALQKYPPKLLHQTKRPLNISSTLDLVIVRKFQFILLLFCLGKTVQGIGRTNSNSIPICSGYKIES